MIAVEAKSLNQAYTIASKLLEPNRRSHGGRVYDIAWYLKDRNFMSLLEIRELAEMGSWEDIDGGSLFFNSYEEAMATFISKPR